MRLNLYDREKLRMKQVNKSWWAYRINNGGVKSTETSVTEILLGIETGLYLVHSSRRALLKCEWAHRPVSIPSKISVTLVSVLLHHHCQSYMPTNFLVKECFNLPVNNTCIQNLLFTALFYT